MSNKLLSITNSVFVTSKPNTNNADEKISNELNNNNYRDWNTSDSSLDADDHANEVYDKEKESVNTKHLVGMVKNL